MDMKSLFPCSFNDLFLKTSYFLLSKMWSKAWYFFIVVDFPHGSVDSGVEFWDDFLGLLGYFFCCNIAFLHFINLVIEIYFISEIQLDTHRVFIRIAWCLFITEVRVLLVLNLTIIVAFLHLLRLESRLTPGWVLELVLFSFNVLFVHLVHLIHFLKP